MSATGTDDRGIIVACEHCGQKNRLVYQQLAGEARCAACKQPLSPPAEPIEVASSPHFDALVANSPLPVIVDYWAPWCGPCRMVAPELQKVAARQAGRFLVVKVNTDDLSDLGERFRIRSIPTMAVFAGGHEVARTSGARPAGDIEAFAEQALRSSNFEVRSSKS
jgi:thioredoxin 2